MSRTPALTGSADLLPSLETILAQATADHEQCRRREAEANEWAESYGADIDAFDEALQAMRVLEGNALHPPPDDFDGQLWVPHLLTAGRLIRERGWEDIVQGFAEVQPYPATQGFVRLLLDIAAGRYGEADVWRCVADLHRAGLVRAMTWQHAFNAWNCEIKSRYNAELRERLTPPVPPAIVPVDIPAPLPVPASSPAFATPVPPPPGTPFFPLTSWADIFDALNSADPARPWANDERRRGQLRDLNERFDGPIRVPSGRGKQPQVDRSLLLSWWARVGERYHANAEDAEQDATCEAATVAATHPHGRSGTVVPDLRGGVKGSKRRGKI